MDNKRCCANCKFSGLTKTELGWYPECINGCMYINDIYEDVCSHFENEYKELEEMER